MFKLVVNIKFPWATYHTIGPLTEELYCLIRAEYAWWDLLVMGQLAFWYWINQQNNKFVADIKIKAIGDSKHNDSAPSWIFSGRLLATHTGKKVAR